MDLFSGPEPCRVLLQVDCRECLVGEMVCVRMCVCGREDVCVRNSSSSPLWIVAVRA